WEPLLNEVAGLAPATRLQRMEQLNARVRETGIAHDLFADPSSTAQPWRVDLIPLVVAPEEWRWLERALIQRARLFEGILADLYGPQKLLASGTIPHQLVFSDPSFCGPVTASGRVGASSCSSPLILRGVLTAGGASSTPTPKPRPVSATQSPIAWCTPTSLGT